MSCDIISTVEPAFNVLYPKVDVHIRDLTHHLDTYSWCVFGRWCMTWFLYDVLCVALCAFMKKIESSDYVFSVDHSYFVIEIVWVPHKLFPSAYQLSN